VPWEVISVLSITYRIVSVDSTLNEGISLWAKVAFVPVLEPIDVSPPKTMSPKAAPVTANVPVVTFDPAVAESRSWNVEPVNAAVPKLTLVMLGPVAPISSVPTVASPALLMVVDAIVPSVFVPVEEVKPVAKVVTPLIVGIVAVLIVAVLIVAVPIVAVPVVAEMLELNVATPVTPRLEDRVTAPVTPRLEDRVAAPVTPKLEDKVAAPVTAKLDDRVVAPAALSVPVERTPAVDSSKAEEVLSPSVITCSVPSKPPIRLVLSNCG
jgi:hypothetical protein